MHPFVLAAAQSIPEATLSWPTLMSFYTVVELDSKPLIILAQSFAPLVMTWSMDEAED